MLFHCHFLITEIIILETLEQVQKFNERDGIRVLQMTHIYWFWHQKTLFGNKKKSYAIVLTIVWTELFYYDYSKYLYFNLHIKLTE